MPFPGASRQRCSNCDNRPIPKLPNPDPKNYKFLDVKQIKNHLAVKLHYPDSINYEGNKIMVYRNTTLIELVNQKAIDPHFSSVAGAISPFARFEPTDEGWAHALLLAEGLK